MTVDNLLLSMKIRMYFIMLIGGVVLCAFYLFMEGGFADNSIITFFGFLCLSTYIAMHLRKLYFVSVSNDDGKIKIRYYYIHPLFQKLNSIEIPFNEFHSYEVQDAYSGFNKYLLIYQKTRKGVAVYPKISIAALQKKEWRKIEDILKKYSTK